MFSKILVKLIDQAIIPAIVLIAVRVTSIALVAKYFGVSYTLDSRGYYFANPTDFTLVNSYSTFFMVVVLAVGILYVLLKSFIFHDTHITPSLTAKIFSLRLSSFIQSSFDLYSQGSVWMSYLYLVTLLAGLMALFGMVYPWVFLVAGFFSIATTILLVFDIENEMAKNPGKDLLDQKETVLELKL